jgi:uncharacterized protein YyaL (SSP411 family)
MEKAEKIAEWIWTNMRDEHNHLASVAYGNEVKGDGNLNDYACTAEGFMVLASMIDWTCPGNSKIWIKRTEQLLETVDKQFSDPDSIGYFFVSADQRHLVHRKKDWYDGATPAGMSSLIHAHAMLYSITGKSSSEEALCSLEKAYPGILHTSPAAASHALAGLVDRAIGHVAIKVRSKEDIEPVRNALTAKPWRPVAVMIADQDDLTATYQLCIGTQCMEPSDDLVGLMEMV